MSRQRETVSDETEDGLIRIPIPMIAQDIDENIEYNTNYNTNNIMNRMRIIYQQFDGLNYKHSNYSLKTRNGHF